MSTLSPITILLAKKLEMHDIVAELRSILYENISQGQSPATEGLPVVLTFDRVHSSLKALFVQGDASFVHKPNPGAESDVAMTTM